MFFDKPLRHTLFTSVSVGAILMGSGAYANPQGGTVVTGDVNINGVGTDHVIIDNNSNKAIVDWQDFSIGVGETTTINQITNDASILNRVVGNNPTEIHGRLESNGKVFVINQSGILVGATGVVDTNGFVASTLNLSNADFLGSGDMLFTQGIETGDGIEVYGKIRSVSGGDIFLLSREVTIHEGAEVDANGGYVGIAAGQEILLKPVDSGDGRISIRAGKGKIVNAGTVAGVAAELKAAGGNEYALAINNTGVVRATGVTRRGGRVMLGGGGTVKNTGRVVSRKKVVVRSKKKIVNAGTVKAGDGNKGGEVVFESPDIEIETTSLIDVSGALGGGRAFIGGGYQGTQNDRDGNAVDISENAETVTVASGAVFDASATTSGDAGDIIIWSEERTDFAGDIKATAADGVGGFAEVSGKKKLNVANIGEIDMAGSQGAGNILFDPEDLHIVTALTPGGNDNQILGSFIEGVLGSGVGVTLSTLPAGDPTSNNAAIIDSASAENGSAPDTNGDIFFEAGVSINWLDDGTGASDEATVFAVHAARDIVAADNVLVRQSDDNANNGDSAGGIQFYAGRHVLLGTTDAATSTASATGRVSIGSEHGFTEIRAGVTAFNTGTVGADGDVVLVGGNNDQAYTQIGYLADADRTDPDAANGDITVLAGGDVKLFGGGNAGTGVDAAFAQIGHGGFTNAPGHEIVSEIVSSDILVRAGLVTNGSVVSLDGGMNSPINQAQIGHGATVFRSDAEVGQKDISGHIAVTAGIGTDGTTVTADEADILLNTNFTAENANDDDAARAQIGHGATLVYGGSGEAAGIDEISHGRIDGIIRVVAADDVKLGKDSVSAGTSDDTFQISSQIGHGGFSFLAYDGTAVSGDKMLSVTYGAIARFDDLVGNGSGGATTHGTDVTVQAGTVLLTAKEAVQNSANYTGDVFDNLISNQIGHGSTTVYSSVDTVGNFQATDDELDPSTNLGTVTGVSYTEEVLFTNQTVSVPFLDLEDANIDATIAGLTVAQQAAVEKYMVDNPSATTIPAGPISGVDYTDTENNTAASVNLSGVGKNGTIGGQAVAIGTVGGLALLTDEEFENLSPEIKAAVQSRLDDLRAALIGTSETGTPSTVGALVDDKLDIMVTEGDIAGDIAVYDTDSTDASGIVLETGISVGLTAITNDRMINRIGHATRNYITAHDGNNSSDDTVGSNNAGDIIIKQANILGADILVDTVSQNSATEENDQDIKLISSVTAGLSKAEANDALNTIGHGGEVLIRSGSGGDSDDGYNQSGHGGDVTITRGTIWDGLEYYQTGGDEYAYGGSVDITIRSSDQIIVDDDVAAALSKAEANNAISQIGSGGIFKVVSGDGGTTSGGGNGGRGGDILINWDNDEGREYGHGSGRNDDDYARGIMGDITLEANHDGTLTGTDGGDGYALDITSDDKAALSKADHNTVIGQIGHGDFMELVSGNGGAGGDLKGGLTNGEQGQVNGGRGGDITVAFNDGDNDRNDLDDLKIESDIFVNVQGAIRGEAVVTNALSPQKHGLVETTIGHGTRVYAVAGDGAEGGVAAEAELIVGYDPDVDDTAGVTTVTNNNGSVDADLRDGDGEILRGGAVGGDGGDVSIALGDITDRYSVTTGGTTTYYHDGLYDLHAQVTDTDYSVSGDSDSDIEVWATHNESGSNKEQSVYFHAQTKHALSEGPGSEVNAQIGHQKRVQAQGGLGAAGGSNGLEQVNFAVVQADFSGGFGGDEDVMNGIIVGDIYIEAERQLKMFAEAGHGKETIVTSLIGHNTHMTSISRAGGNGGDLYSGLGNTDNNVQEYWETGGTGGANTAYLTVDRTVSGNNPTNTYSVTYDANGDGDTTDAGDTQNVSISSVFGQLQSNDGISTIEDLDGFDFDSAGYLSDFEKIALQRFIADIENSVAGSTGSPLFELILQDLNQDDQFSLGDSDTLGTNADVVDDSNSYHDDGIGIAIDGNDAVDTDKEIKTASHQLLNQTGGVDQDLNENATALYRSGVNPDRTNNSGAISDRDASSGTPIFESALMVYDSDGNPQFIAVTDVTGAHGTAGDQIFVANTQENRNAITASGGNFVVDPAFAGTSAFVSNVDDGGSGTADAQWVYRDINNGDDNTNTITSSDIGSVDGHWVYNTAYDAADDSSTDKFTYVDLNLDQEVDLVDFDADGKFDVVDIDQNGVYDRIDGRVGNTGAQTVAQMGHDDKGNANIIDYSSNTGMNYDASHTEGGWQVADLSHADGGRGGNASVAAAYIEGDISVQTGNVNFAENEAYDGTVLNNDLSPAAARGAAATGVTDSLVVEVDVQDNIVATGGEDDTVIARIGHGAYNYADTAGESDDNKVGRTLFFTDTDNHGAAEGGDAGKHALNASGGDGGDAQSILGDVRIITLVRNSGSGWSHGDSELDHLVGDIAVNTRMSKTDNTIVWDPNANLATGGWVRNGGYRFVADPTGDGIVDGANTVAVKIQNESSANRVKVASKVDNASKGNVGIAQIGHGAISIADATAALGGDGESGNGSEIEAHQTEIANGGHGGSAGSIAHHVKGDIEIKAGRAPDPSDEVTSIELTAEEGPRIVPGSNGDIVIAQFGHGRIGYAGGGAGGESDDGQWYANGGDGGDAITIQRDILDTSITVNTVDLGGHGMDVLATALQGSNHIVRSQVGHGDINFAESNAGGDAAPSKSSVVEQWNQQANGGRGGDAIALQAGYNYDITVDVGSAPDTMDADKASLRIVTDAQNIFLGTENHILATIGSGGYSHAESASASGGDGSNRSALGGISTGDSRTPFSTYVSHREGGRGGNAISEIGIDGTGNVLSGRERTGSNVINDRYLDDHTTGADITVRTHDRSYDSSIYAGLEKLYSYGNVISTASGDTYGTSGTVPFIIDGDGEILSLTDMVSAGVLNADGSMANQDAYNLLTNDVKTASLVDRWSRFDGILVESKAGPGDNHTRAIDTNTAQIGHSGFNRADALAGQGIKDSMMFGRVSPTNADGGKGIQSIFSANIQEGDGGNGGDAFAYTGSVTGDIVVTNNVAGDANDAGTTVGGIRYFGATATGEEDEDTNIVFRATGGTVSSDHRVDARAGHMVASEAVTDSNGGNAARPPQPVISFIGAVSSRAGAAGDASSIQELLTGDVTVTAENSIIMESKKTTLGGDEGFFVGVGHRLENDLEALGQGGISGMIGAAGTVMQATFKDDGDDDRDDATQVGSNKADEQGNLLATYRALYEVKQRMLGQWTAVGGTTADAAVDFPTAYGRLSAYEQSLVRAVLGDPTSTGENNYRLITKIISGDEDESFYNSYTNGNFDIVSNSRDDVDGSRTASIIKSSTTDASNDHRFGSLDRNEGYGSGKNVYGVAGDHNSVNALAIIFGNRDNDAATSGTETPSTANPGAASDVDEAQWGNIPEPSADEIEALRYMMAASGDGGNVRSIQGTLSGDVLLVANAYDSDGNTGVDHSQANARGIYVISEDAALSGTDLFAVVGHGSELIKARAGDAGLHHDTAVQTTASVGGDGGDASVEQGMATGNISLQSGYVIDVEARNNGLGFSEEDTRIGHQLKVGSLLEDFSTGTQAAVVAGIGGQDAGLGSSTRNGSGGDVTITQGGASGAILLETNADIADGEGLSISDADGTVDEIAIAIFADNPNLSGDHTEVQIGHDQHIDSAQAGDAGRMHALNTYEANKGLIGVTEGKGGNVTVTQGLLTSDDITTSSTQEDITISAKDIVMAKGFISNGGKTRTLIGHDTTAGKEWQDGELDGTAGNKLVAGNGGDSFVEMFDDTDGGEADGGTVTVTQGNIYNNGTSTYYQALQGDIVITSRYNKVIALSETGNGGDVYTEIGHQLKLSAESGNGGVQRGITQQTAGDGGNIWVTRGRIEGNVTLTADGRDTSAGTTETTTDTTDVETEADGIVLVDAKNGSGGTTETLLGHGSESILTTGRSGFSQEFDVTKYDGDDAATANAESAIRTIAEAFVDIRAKTAPNADSTDTATFTNVDKRDAYRLISNTIAALKSAQQYTDRMTTDEAANLAASISEAEAALSDLGIAELPTTRVDVDMQDSVADAYSTARTAVIRGRNALIAALFGGAGYNDGGLADADTRAGTTDIYRFLFGDHADGGDIYVDENSDRTAADSAKIIGDVTLTGNSTEGVIRTQSGYGTGTLSVVELGHRLEIINTTGEGGGETDGGPPEDGEAGDGGNITEHNDVSGGVTLSANRLVVTSDGAVTSLTHFGHDLDSDNLAGMSDIASNGMGNGGTIVTSQIASGNVTLNANEVSDSETGMATAKLTISGSDSTLDLGHMADLLSESDDDGRVGGPINSVEYNRGGDITSSQTVGGTVTINLDLDGNGSDQDLIIDAGGTATNAIDIMHDATQSAFSGKAGHGDDGDGQLVTVMQDVSGDLFVNSLEDLNILSTGGSINIGHDASNTGISGQVNPGDGDEYGERVDADQNVSGGINLSANRSVTIDIMTAVAQPGHIGHTAIQEAKSADDGGNFDTEEGYRDGSNNLLVADVDADQTVDGGLSITSGEILLKSAGLGGLHYGHEVTQNTETDFNTGAQPGHIEANSRVTGDLSLIADITSDNGVHQNIGSDDVAAITSTPMGTVTLTGDAGLLQFGHRGNTTTGHNEATASNGSVDAEQTITSNITVDVDEDLLGTSGATGKVLVGHSIVENNAGMGTATGKGHENTFVDANGDTQVSDVAQRVNGNIDVTVDDFLSLEAGVGEIQIGHESLMNVAQIGVSDQQLIGDITVNVGTDANGTPDGDASNGDDDALLTAGAATGVHIGHEITEDANNEVQIASGDIWLKVGADLEVTMGQIGHKGYDFDQYTPDADTSYDLTTAKAAALAAGTVGTVLDTDVAADAGIGATRNRIQGNTTIGSAQNSPSEDSTLQADVMKFTNSFVNSGYGGEGDKDVDGELRFFLPAQEGLTITSTVFNDSQSAAPADAVPDRVSNADNVFEAEGGLDHEHDFELMSETATYSDDVIGPANFGFYFETTPGGSEVNEFTPFFIETRLGGGFSITYDECEEGSVNSGGVAGENYIGTGSGDICGDGGTQRYNGFQQGAGSNVGFSGTGGGGQSFDFDEGQQDDDDLVSGFSPIFESNLSGRQVEPITVTRVQREPTTRSANRFAFVIHDRQPSRLETAKVEVKEATFGFSAELSRNFNNPKDMNTFGEYVEVGNIDAQISQQYPGALSIASSHLLYESKL